MPAGCAVGVVVELLSTERVMMTCIAVTTV